MKTVYEHFLTYADSQLAGKDDATKKNVVMGIKAFLTEMDMVEEADDYYFPPITGTYLRLSRMLIAIMTLQVTPIFLLFMQNLFAYCTIFFHLSAGRKS